VTVVDAILLAYFPIHREIVSCQREVVSAVVLGSDVVVGCDGTLRVSQGCPVTTSSPLSGDAAPCTYFGLCGSLCREKPDDGGWCPRENTVE